MSASSSPAPSSSSPSPDQPRLAYRTALGRYKGARLAAIRLAQGLPPESDRIRPAAGAEELTQHLDQPAAVEALAARVPIGSRLALSLFAVTERTSMPVTGLSHALTALGAEPIASMVPLLELGLLVIEPNAELGPIDEFATILKQMIDTDLRILVHPTVPHAVRTVRPGDRLPAVAGPVVQVRESDGLEPVLRLGALWQRAGVEPIRRTQQGDLYKRDRERIGEDPVLSGPIADAMVPLTGLARLWLELAGHVGVIEPDPSGQRLEAAPPGFWIDNAVHLPHMIATGWLALESCHELGESSADRAANLAVPYLRPALLFWLATLGDGEWVALDDLATHLGDRYADWSRPHLGNNPSSEPGPSRGPARRRTPPSGRSGSIGEMGSHDQNLLRAILLGAAYPLGLVRAAEEVGSGRRVVQLTPLGRYALAAGPTPPPRPTFDQFLFVQPNFEMIAYRQGLTARLVGRLSRFAWWSQLGAAVELKLTRNSIELGLAGGLTAESMIETLSRHTQRPLPTGVVDAIRTWSTRRERVTYYAAATLIEFGTAAERDEALESWPRDNREAPTPVAERYLLVNDESTIPFDRFRLTGSRDYRRPPEACVTVEPDGVSMALDPARSDLLVDAELGRFADEALAVGQGGERTGNAEPRRYVVTPASLRRAMNRGVNAQQLADWFVRRTGGEIPPAVRLILAPRTARVPPLQVIRLTVLSLPSVDLLDGLLQHPATKPWLGERLGPRTVAIADDNLPPLQSALRELGIVVEGG